jgi:hypothetical protein
MDTLFFIGCLLGILLGLVTIVAAVVLILKIWDGSI